MTDPYEVLGVEKDATTDEINTAYKAAAKRTHPDAGGNTDDFMAAKGAAMVLLDPVKRKKFDETGTIDSDKPDNARAEVMEAIANFFITSIDAADNFGAPPLAQINLVEVATLHFKNQVHGAKSHIDGLNKKIKKFDKVLERLKTKSASDPISDMLKHHRSLMQGLVTNTRAQISQFELAVEILKDYDFEPDQEIGTVYPTNGLFRGFRTF